MVHWAFQIVIKCIHVMVCNDNTLLLIYSTAITRSRIMQYMYIGGQPPLYISYLSRTKQNRIDIRRQRPMTKGSKSDRK